MDVDDFSDMSDLEHHTVVTKSTIDDVTIDYYDWSTTDGPFIVYEDLTYYVIALPLGVLIFLANISALCYLIFGKLLRNPANHYVASLALADTGVGIFLIVFNFTISPHGTLQNCLIHLCFIAMICSVSIFSILAIAVDRYVFLVKAIYYYQRATFRHSIFIVLITWASGAIVGFIPMMGQRNRILVNGRCSLLTAINPAYLVAIMGFFLLFPVVTIVALYGRILHLAIQQRRKALRQSYPFDLNSSRANSAYSWRGIAILRGLRAAKIVIAVVGVFLLTWIPYFVSVFVQVICGNDCENVDTVCPYLLLLGCLNSLINPCIYACFGMEMGGSKCFSCKPYLRIFPRLETVAWRVL